MAGIPRLVPFVSELWQNASQWQPAATVPNGPSYWFAADAWLSGPDRSDNEGAFSAIRASEPRRERAGSVGRRRNGRIG